jgi:hypothetical protein
MPHLASMTKKPLELDSVPEVVVLQADIVDEAREVGVAAARVAWLNKSRSDFQYWQQCAELIKNEVEKAMGPTWHVIVGEHFGAYIAFEVKKCFYFSVGEMVRPPSPFATCQLLRPLKHLCFSSCGFTSPSINQLLVPRYAAYALLDGRGRAGGGFTRCVRRPPPRFRESPRRVARFRVPRCPGSFRAASLHHSDGKAEYEANFRGVCRLFMGSHDTRCVPVFCPAVVVAAAPPTESPHVQARIKLSRCSRASSFFFVFSLFHLEYSIHSHCFQVVLVLSFWKSSAAQAGSRAEANISREDKHRIALWRLLK